MIVIRKLDNYNFVLSEKLNEPVVKLIAGKEITYNYKNIDKFYGRLHDAILGLCRHLKKPNLYLNIKIRPDECEGYDKYLNVDYKTLKGLLNENIKTK